MYSNTVKTSPQYSTSWKVSCAHNRTSVSFYKSQWCIPWNAFVSINKKFSVIVFISVFNISSPESEQSDITSNEKTQTVEYGGAVHIFLFENFNENTIEWN